jgi:hypothetical protein
MFAVQKSKIASVEVSAFESFEHVFGALKIQNRTLPPKYA